MNLSQAQTQQLHDQGYVVIPGLIPREMVDAALKAINHSIGAGMEPSKIDSFYKVSFCPELCDSPVITDLLIRTDARELVESALGAGKVVWPKSGQLALRFPTMRAPQLPRAHVDGMIGPRDGDPGSLDNFTAVVGVQLSDLPRAGMGNIAVWPGSHLRCAEYFRQHGEAVFFNGMPPIDFGDPIQLTCMSGDLVLMHYLLVHGITLNHSPHVRYTTYFRLKHIDHDRQKFESMLDPWLHWESVRDLAKSSPASDGRAVRLQSSTSASRSILSWFRR